MGSRTDQRDRLSNRGKPARRLGASKLTVYLIYLAIAFSAIGLYQLLIA